MMVNFSDVVDGLGTGPAMTMVKRVETADDLALLARKTKIAPSETYTLGSINGVKSLENVYATGAKQGKLLKRVKLATRQQKLFGKALAIIPAGLLVIILFLSTLIFFYTFFSRKKSI